LDELRPNINIDDEKEAKLIKEVTDALRKLTGDVDEWFKKAPK
jgi:phenylpyruvate tautomerase PptA (4-oxalocrotonate tautomerase family)